LVNITPAIQRYSCRVRVMAYLTKVAPTTGRGVSARLRSTMTSVSNPSLCVGSTECWPALKTSARWFTNLNLQASAIPSPQLVEQRLGVLQHRRVETFGEPAVDRGEKMVGFRAVTLVAAQPG